MIDWLLPDDLTEAGTAFRLGEVGEDAARYRGFRVPSARRRGFDYAAGWFFVTFVTRSRTRCLGEIRRGAMHLNALGRVVLEEWHRTGTMRPGVVLDAVVVLPDHVHAIIGIVDGRTIGMVKPGTDGAPTPTSGRDAPRGVSTGDFDGPDAGTAPRFGARREWRPGVLGAVVNHWKGACTRHIRRDHDPAFAWQPRFYDVILRDERRLHLARVYVLDNAALHASRGDYR
ncbi:MAG: hypothetical protein AAF791_12790 [Bacteroidota bacterium]